MQAFCLNAIPFLKTQLKRSQFQAIFHIFPSNAGKGKMRSSQVGKINNLMSIRNVQLPEYSSVFLLPYIHIYYLSTLGKIIIPSPCLPESGMLLNAKICHANHNQISIPCITLQLNHCYEIIKCFSFLFTNYSQFLSSLSNQRT